MVVDDLPEEEQVIRASACQSSLGGGVSIATATAALCDATTVFLDRLGSDTTSSMILESMRDHGVDTSSIEIDPDARASLATILVHRSTATRTIVFAPGNERELLWRPEYASLVASAKVIHLNGRHLDVCKQAVQVAKKNDTLVSYDGGAHRFRESIVPLLPHVDVLIVAEDFARRFYDHVFDKAGDSASIAELLVFLQTQSDCRLAGVTQGVRGSDFLDNQGDHWHQSADVMGNAVDTTGCGDVFHGAFLAELIRGKDFQECSRFASQIAGRNTLGLGALAFPCY